MLERVSLSREYALIEDPSSSYLEEVYRLRVLAWKPQARILQNRFQWGPDCFDQTGRHWCILFENRVVAAIRLTIHWALVDIPAAPLFLGVVPESVEPPIASFNRLVVHPDHRGRGLAKALDVCCINAAEIAGASVLLGATGHVQRQRSRIDAMVSLGFTILGPAAVLDYDLIDIIENQQRPTVLAYFLQKT